MYRDPNGEAETLALCFGGPIACAVGVVSTAAAVYFSTPAGQKTAASLAKSLGSVFSESESESSSDDRGNDDASGAEKLPDLTGKSRDEAGEVLEENGFEHQGSTDGGYDKWYHPDGSRVQIRPDGEVVRSGPKRTPEGGGKRYRPRHDQSGNKTNNHSTGERLRDP